MGGQGPGGGGGPGGGFDRRRSSGKPLPLRVSRKPPPGPPTPPPGPRLPMKITTPHDWLVYLLLPGTREKLQGGFLEGLKGDFPVVFGLLPDENSEKNLLKSF